MVWNAKHQTGCSRASSASEEYVTGSRKRHTLAYFSKTYRCVVGSVLYYSAYAPLNYLMIFIRLIIQTNEWYPYLVYLTSSINIIVLTLVISNKVIDYSKVITFTEFYEDNDPRALWRDQKHFYVYSQIWRKYIEIYFLLFYVHQIWRCVRYRHAEEQRE